VVEEPARIAVALLDEFGSLGALLAGSQRRIERIAGAGVASSIGAVGEAMRQVLYERIADRPLLGDGGALLDYLRFDLQHRRTEQVRLLHLDASNRLIRDEVLSDGTIDEAKVHVREVIGRCLELGSAGLILVHNHPSGNPTPSAADLAITHSIADLGSRLGIIVHDHIIIGRPGHVSLRAWGELR
jgi:DNA repair protein RadC